MKIALAQLNYTIGDIAGNTAKMIIAVERAKQAEADAAKTIEAENQRRAQEIATAEANLARQEKQIELEARAVEITKRKLEAEIKEKAEAEKYAEKQRADVSGGRLFF